MRFRSDPGSWGPSPDKARPCRIVASGPCVVGAKAYTDSHWRNEERRARSVLKMSTRQMDFIDDLTGLQLPPDLCRAARRKELEYFESKGVW